jgi:hypothetical protein
MLKKSEIHAAAPIDQPNQTISPDFYGIPPSTLCSMPFAPCALRSALCSMLNYIRERALHSFEVNHAGKQQCDYG